MRVLLSFIVLIMSSVVSAGDSYELKDIVIDNFSVKGNIQSWKFTKVCIDGQVYILVNGMTGPNGITASFKEGKPETCPVSK